LKQAYLHHKGDMSKIINEVYLYTYEDEDRYRKILENMINKGELKRFKVFNTSGDDLTKLKRQKKAQNEALEALEAAKVLGISDIHNESSSAHLHQLIRKKGEERMTSIIQSLEAKYKKQKSIPSKSLSNKRQSPKKKGSRHKAS
jgi:hypothetical protein